MSSTASSVKQGHIVRAGAGAGKTTRLVGKVLDDARAYRQENGTWPMMIVTTFTIKATQELRARLMKKAIEIEDSEFLEFVSNPQQLQISTLHGVFYSFLRRYAHLLGLDANLDLYSGEEYYKLTTQALREIIFKNEEFRDLLERYGFHHLRKMGLEFYERVLVYPDMKMANADHFKEIQQQVYLRHYQNLEQVRELILDSVEDAKWRGYAESLSLILALLKPISKGDVADGLQILEALSSLGAKPRKNKNIDEGVSDLLAECLKQIKSELSRPAFQSELWRDYFKDFTVFEKMALEFTQKLFDLKIESGKLEMSDIELMTLKFLTESPHVGNEFSQQWDFWLIDEYQDTSPLQVKILENLIGERPYFIVGDPQQSIYLFRGARSEVFDKMQEQVEEEGGLSETLQKNYRSAPELLCFFNDLFHSLGPQFQAMEPRQEEFEAEKVVAQFHFLETGKDSKSSSLLKDEKDNPEYQMVADRIEQLRKKSSDEESTIRWDEICILAKTHKELARIARFLSQKGYPTFVHSSAGFYSRRETQDAMCLLRFLLSTYDDTNLMSLLRSPWFKVNDEVLLKSVAEVDNNYWHVVQHIEEPAILHLKRLLKICTEEGVSEAFELGLIESSMMDTSQREDETGRKESNLWKIVQWLREQERAPGFNPMQAYQQVQRSLQLGVTESAGEAVAALEPNSINFMTIHASKGLEFKHVFLVGMHKALRLSKSRPDHSLFNFHERLECWSFGVQLEGETTKSSSVIDIDYLKDLEHREYDEFLRLLYVAATRAEKTLDLFWGSTIEKNSWAKALNFNLSEGVHHKKEYSYQVNVGRWEDILPRIQNKSDENQPSFVGLDSRSDYELGEIVKQRRLWRETPPEEGGLKKYSVSAWLNRDVSMEMSPKRKSKLLDQLNGAHEGVVLHKIFEWLRYNHDFDWSHWLSQWVSKERWSDFNDAIYFAVNLETPPLAHLLTNGHAEWGFQMKIPQGLLEGQVDLWGVHNGEAWIVDYKTGRSQNINRAMEQLQLYSLALQEVHQFKKVHLCVLNPILKKVHTELSPQTQELKVKFGFL